MNVRISKSLVAAALALPLLAGCGASNDVGTAPSTAPATSSGAPSGSSAPTSPSVSPADTPSQATPNSDPAADKKDVADASTKFVTTVLTIGYPDKSYTKDYLPRLKKLMTDDGYTKARTSETESDGNKALKQLYGQRTRSTPDITGDPKVSDLQAGSATVRVSYQGLAQMRQGDGWKTLKKLDKGSVTLSLVKDGNRWLVDDAT